MGYSPTASSESQMLCAEIGAVVVVTTVVSEGFSVVASSVVVVIVVVEVTVQVYPLVHNCRAGLNKVDPVQL